MSEFDELKEAARPLIEYLKEHYNPECVAVVQVDRVEVMAREISAPIEVKN